MTTEDREAETRLQKIADLLDVAVECLVDRDSARTAEFRQITALLKAFERIDDVEAREHCIAYVTRCAGALEMTTLE